MKEIINYLYAFQSSTSVIGNANLNRSFASLVTKIRDCVLKVIFSFQGLVVQNPPASARDVRDAASVLGWGRFSGTGNGNRLQYSCLENSMDRAAWWAIAHQVARSLSTAQHIQILNSGFFYDLCSWKMQKTPRFAVFNFKYLHISFAQLHATFPTQP